MTWAKHEFPVIKVCTGNANENITKVVTPFENKPNHTLICEKDVKDVQQVFID